ncbi:ABC transporter permease [Chryseolinea sp. H1M3-3]|uniref:ABC transporter permease n=1 Tax=Chryseolinea sp. H1M3-3 TaxID=3034144 RepID=UPI0023EAF98F|nr:ABC transporter permease [Chryseolinea sp. H1M3-3]
MLKNYILVAWRSILKNRLFSAINIIGLALSMSVCMIVLVRLMDSLTYDNFHQDKEKIFRVISEINSSNGSRWDFASTPLPLAEELSKDSILFEQVTQLYPSLNDVTTPDIKELDIHGAFAEASFFRLFSFPLKYGEPASALSQPYSIVLSEKLAVKLFGNIDPSGKTISLKKFGIFTVTGVLETTAQKSHITFAAFASISTVPLLESLGKLPTKHATWDSFEQGYTYLKMKSGIENEILVNTLKRISAAINKSSSEGSFNFHAQPLRSITPGISDMVHEIGRGPTRGSLLAEAGVALIILAAAAFNYTNLSVARGLSRGKEVGIRKLSGAKRHQIFFQYILESVILAILALLIANVIFAFILEYEPFNDGYEMVPAITPGLGILSVFTLFAILAGVFSGAMPAWILSSFQPARVLRNIGSEKILGNLSGRKVLMVFQFTLSLIVLVFLSAFNRQFEFLEKSDPGFRSTNQFMIPSAGKLEQIEHSLEQVNGIKRVGFTSNAFTNRNSLTVKGSLLRTDERPISFNYYSCNPEFVVMADLKVIDGHLFSSAENSSEEILVNEKAAVALGFKTTGEALGHVLFFEDSVKGKIAGVVKNFYDNGYGNPIQPLIIRNDPLAFRYTVVEAEGHPLKNVPEDTKTAWKKMYPDQVFEFTWIDKELKDEKGGAATFSMLGFLTFMTITIASMGLLGLVVYTAEIRRREMSIRKIIGARVDQIIALLSRGFVMLLLIAAVIALPIGYVLSQWFLMNFTNRIAFGITDLLSSLMILLTIGLTIILSQTWKVSIENPARNLRSE